LSDRAVIRRVGSVVVALTLVLMLVLCAWIIAPGVTLRRIFIAIVATAPLWVCLPKIIAGHRRVCALLTLLLVPYLVLALTEAIANPVARPWAGMTLFVAFGLFVTLIAFLRVSREPPSLPARTAP
jgi:uncharacterized membrane protein